MKINYTAIIFTVIALVAMYLYRVFGTQNYLIVSVKESDKQGLYYALSNDGLNWKALNNSEKVTKATLGIETIRDPFIARDNNIGYHLIYISDTLTLTFSYAYSKDLISWSDFKRIQVFQGNDSIKNVKSPALIFDSEQGEWIVYYSCIMYGDYYVAEGQGKRGMKYRIYAFSTKDFKTFSDPFLLFDPGYSASDATIIENKDDYKMCFKIDRSWPREEQLKMASSKSLYGPWLVGEEHIALPLVGKASMLKVKEKYLIYYHTGNNAKEIQILSTSDMNHFVPIEDKVSFPDQFKIGSVIKISHSDAKNLMAEFMALK